MDNKRRNKKYIKVAIIGDSGVGKTSIIKSFLGEDVKNVKSTIAIDNYIIKRDDVTIVLWDFAGQRWFSDILINFIKGASLIILVFDLSDPRTLKSVTTYWAENIKKYADPDTVILLIGNKVDKNVFDHNALIKYLDKIKNDLNFHVFLKTSALNGSNISRLFNIIFELVKSFDTLRRIKIAKS